MMKLSVLVAVAVLLLELTTAQAAAPATSGRRETVRSSLLEKKVSLLNPALEGRVPPPPSEDPVEGPQNTPEFENEMSLQSGQREMSLYSHPRHGNLEWQWFNGGEPNEAVKIDNGYTHRRDYVCQSRCQSGFYTPSKGPYCYYPDGGRERRSGRWFKILVNKNNIENLSWMQGSNGRVPENSVTTCNGDIYVAKNRYGLGKVHARHTAFFLPWSGREYWYKRYDVLTVRRATLDKQRISNVYYRSNQLKISHKQPTNLQISRTYNHGCQTVMKTVSLSRTTGVQRTWNSGISTTSGVTTSISTGIPDIASGSISISVEKTKTLSRGTTVHETNSNAVSIEVKVPPNHSCNVRMMGFRMRASIPYTARLTRTYRNGKTQSISISGTFRIDQVGEIRAVIDRCVRLEDAKPCPE